MIGENIPVPSENLIWNVQSLCAWHLGEIARHAFLVTRCNCPSPWANACIVHGDPIRKIPAPPDGLSPAWQEAEVSLLLYGLAACRQNEVSGRAMRQVTDVAKEIVRCLAERGASVRHHVPHLRLTSIQRVTVRTQLPSWWRTHSLHVRHRAALLSGPYRLHYRKLGWRAQVEAFVSTPDLSLPPNDVAMMVPVAYDTDDNQKSPRN